MRFFNRPARVQTLLSSGLLLVVLTGLFPSPVFSARLGTVRDSKTKSPISGAVVTVFSSGRQFLTDAQGRFDLPSDSHEILSVAARNYLPLKITVASATDNIELTPVSSFEHAKSQSDGSLLIQPVKSAVSYDFTNSRVLARLDSRFRLTRYAVIGGDELLNGDGWRTRITLDGSEIELCDAFRVRAGLAEATIRRPGVELALAAFVDSDTSAVFLNFTFVNVNHQTHHASIDLTVQFLSASAVLGSGPSSAEDGHLHREFTSTREGDAVGQEWAVVVAADRESYAQAVRGFYESTRAVAARSDLIAGTLTTSDPLLKTMFTATLDNALASFKSVPDYNFAAFFAGIRYRMPLRAYYRDSYWTVQLVLPFHPEYVRSNLLFLAKGIQPDGRAPSALTYDGKPFNNFHYDSPAFFVMELYDYLAWTNDASVLAEAWPKAQQALAYLISTDHDGKGLMEKPDSDQGDWADEVFRSYHVTYNEALYYRALVCASRIALVIGNRQLATEYETRAARAKEMINKDLWLEGPGHYADYRRRDGSVEAHLTHDSLITALYGIASEPQSARLLARTRNGLETRIADPRLAEWGILSCNPLYERPSETVRSSFLPYSYHNGADWPYLDGIDALVRLWVRDENWRYPLLQWWRYGLERNWLTPAEVYSAYYPDGRALNDDFGLRQAWSSMPGAAIILGGFGFWPELDGTVGAGVPPWGDSTITGIRHRGNIYSIVAKGGRATLYRNQKKWLSVDSGSRIRVRTTADDRVELFGAPKPVVVTVWAPTHKTVRISKGQDVILP